VRSPLGFSSGPLVSTVTVLPTLANSNIIANASELGGGPDDLCRWPSVNAERIGDFDLTRFHRQEPGLPHAKKHREPRIRFQQIRARSDL
jgi:hypothetical protein